MSDQLEFGDSDTLVTLNKAWQRALTLLSPEINRPSFESFIKTAKPVGLDDSTATIEATSELARIFLEKYRDHVSAALSEALKTDINAVFVVASGEKSKEQAEKPASSKQKPTGGVIESISLPLNYKYTFPSFVVGPCNRLAHAAALSIAKKPGRIYNPFFVYSGAGLGKTHLLQAIGHSIIEAHPKMRVAYVSGEMFTSQYINAIRDRKSDDFRQKYRNIDVWLLDDIQFLADKERTKEEFFHTFNVLYQTNKHIVISSDKSPKDLNLFNERFRSRFESGLVVDLAPPDLETRIAILQNKADAESSDIPFEIIECIANMIPANIRALEGALVTVLAYTSLVKKDVSIQLTQEVLCRYLTEKKINELSLDTIQRAVAQFFEVELKEMLGDGRRKELSTSRQVAIYLCRSLTPYSLIVIGKAFGGRDHATVVHACKKIESLTKTDSSFGAMVEKLTEDLKTGRIS